MRSMMASFLFIPEDTMECGVPAAIATEPVPLFIQFSAALIAMSIISLPQIINMMALEVIHG